MEECSRRGLGRPIAGGADGSLLNGGGERSRPPSVGVRCLLIIIIGKSENHKNDFIERKCSLYIGDKWIRFNA